MVQYADCRFRLIGIRGIGEGEDKAILEEAEVTRSRDSVRVKN